MAHYLTPMHQVEMGQRTGEPLEGLHCYSGEVREGRCLALHGPPKLTYWQRILRGPEVQVVRGKVP